MLRISTSEKLNKYKTLSFEGIDPLDRAIVKTPVLVKEIE